MMDPIKLKKIQALADDPAASEGERRNAQKILAEHYLFESTPSQDGMFGSDIARTFEFAFKDKEGEDVDDFPYEVFKRLKGLEKEFKFTSINLTQRGNNYNDNRLIFISIEGITRPPGKGKAMGDSRMASLAQKVEHEDFEVGVFDDIGFDMIGQNLPADRFLARYGFKSMIMYPFADKQKTLDLMESQGLTYKEIAR